MLQANARAAGAAPPDSWPSSPRCLLMRRLARQPAPMRAGQPTAQPSRRHLDRHHPQCSASADQEQGNRACPGCRLRDPAKPGVKRATVAVTAQYQQIKRVLGGVGARPAWRARYCGLSATIWTGRSLLSRTSAPRFTFRVVFPPGVSVVPVLATQRPDARFRHPGKAHG